MMRHLLIVVISLVAIAHVLFGSTATCCALADSIDLDAARLWPENVMQLAAENWKRLEELRREHVVALKELERGVAEGEKLTNRTGARVALLGRIMTTELELVRRPAEREKVCKQAINQIDKLGRGADKLDRSYIDAGRAGFGVELQLAKCPAHSPEEIRALVEQAEATVALYREVHAKYAVGARGGEAEKEARMGYELCHRVAKLLTALGRHEEAVKRRMQACEYATMGVHAAQAAYEAGTITLDLLLEAQRDRAQAWIDLAKIDPAAERELRQSLGEGKSIR